MKTTTSSISKISNPPRILLLAALTMAISACLGASSTQAALIARIDGTFPIGGVASQAANVYQTYCFQSTATSSTTLLSLLFRNDPAWTAMDNVSVVKTGTSVNLLLNGGFDTSVGGHIPDNWLAVGTQGLPAAGDWNPGGGNGYWLDGAIGGFDGLAQVVATTPGDSYTICFDLRSNTMNNPVSIATEVYFGDLPPGNVVTGVGSGANVIMPEPTGTMFLGLSLGGLALRRRRRASKADSGMIA
jgi:hypothetical protein